MSGVNDDDKTTVPTLNLKKLIKKGLNDWEWFKTHFSKKISKKYII